MLCLRATNVLTAATLKYTTGVGITAAAGTQTCPPVVALPTIYARTISKLLHNVQAYLFIRKVAMYNNYLVVLTSGNLRTCCHP